MRILIFYQYFGTPRGSWSTRMYEFARRWVNRGHQITVVTAPYEKSDIKAEKFITKKEIEGINLIIINSPDSNRKSTFKRAINALIFSAVSVWYSMTLNFDVVLSSSGPITVGIPALIAKWIRRKKMVFEVRDLWPQGAVELGKIRSIFIIRLAYFFEKVLYKNSALVVPCSVGMLNAIHERFPSLNTLVIPNASDVDLFSPRGFQLPNINDVKYFIYAGSLGLIDDCGQLIRAANKIVRNDIKFIIIGEGSERKYLEEYSKSNPNIIFLGLLPKVEVVSWYQKAWASIVTFKDTLVLHTNSANKLFDSFAAGVPVIQNTQGWIKDLFEEEECGLSVPQNNPEKFAEAIVNLADNASLRNKFAQNAFRLAINMFNRDILAEKYIKAIEAL